MLVYTMPLLIYSVGMTARTYTQLLKELVSGLEDYTMDQRGDVGSWIRMACIRGITTIYESAFRVSKSIPNLLEYLPPTLFHAGVAGILQQGVGRLDNVRHEVGLQVRRLLDLPLLDRPDASLWRIHGAEILESLFAR